MNDIDLTDINNWPDGATHHINGSFTKWVNGSEYTYSCFSGCWERDDIDDESWSLSMYEGDSESFTITSRPNDMSKHNNLQLLVEWEECVKDFDLKLSHFVNATMIALESPHIESAHKMLEHYTQVVSGVVDIPSDILMDWWLEYDFGNKPMKVYIGKELIAEVSTLQELVDTWEKVK